MSISTQEKTRCVKVSLVHYSTNLSPVENYSPMLKIVNITSIFYQNQIMKRLFAPSHKAKVPLLTTEDKPMTKISWTADFFSNLDFYKKQSSLVEKTKNCAGKARITPNDFLTDQ